MIHWSAHAEHLQTKPELSCCTPTHAHTVHAIAQMLEDIYRSPEAGADRDGWGPWGAARPQLSPEPLGDDRPSFFFVFDRGCLDCKQPCTETRRRIARNNNHVPERRTTNLKTTLAKIFQTF